MTSDYEAQFLAQLDAINRVLAFVCRRHRLSADEAEEFKSVARLKLVEHDYAVLRAFQGRSSIQTYLTVVIQRLFLDYRISAWGKWRPSAEARRLGPTAVLLEKLTVRDGLSFGEACQVMRTNHGAPEDEAALDAIGARLPQRTRRRIVDDGELSLVVGSSHDGEVSVLRAEAETASAQGFAALEEALAELPAEDRLIVKYRFEQGLQVSEIARLMRLEQKPLYRRIEVILRGLRVGIEARGVRQADIGSWFSWRESAGTSGRFATDTGEECPSL